MQSLFEFITHPMELGLIYLVSTVGNAGIGIILFTILVRLILSPLQIAQLRNAKAMQRLQPLVAELRQKHGSDRQKMSEATMALYREHQVNPAMGCLPTLFQFPILIGLFYALLHLGSIPNGYPHPTVATWATESCGGHPVHNIGQWLARCYAVASAPGSTAHIFDLFHANFLWLSDGLGRPDPLYILPILAGVTQWVQSRMMLTRSTDPQQQMMNTMMNFMPLMIVFFATRYASGLSLYWVTSTLIGILIQYRITGWGLLPGVNSLISVLRPQPAAPRKKPVPNQSKVRRVAPPQAPTLDGADGNGDQQHSTNGDQPQAMTAVARQRKKANRARGGRGGGRRG